MNMITMLCVITNFKFQLISIYFQRFSVVVNHDNFLLNLFLENYQ